MILIHSLMNVDLSVFVGMRLLTYIKYILVDPHIESSSTLNSQCFYPHRHNTTLTKMTSAFIVLAVFVVLTVSAVCKYTLIYLNNNNY